MLHLSCEEPWAVRTVPTVRWTPRASPLSVMGTFWMVSQRRCFGFCHLVAMHKLSTHLVQSLIYFVPRPLLSDSILCVGFLEVQTLLISVKFEGPRRPQDNGLNLDL
jgi:hypothetical protein